MYVIDISNNFRLMSNFVYMIYIIVSFNPTFNFVMPLCDKEFSDGSCVCVSAWITIIFLFFFDNESRSYLILLTWSRTSVVIVVIGIWKEDRDEASTKDGNKFMWEHKYIS